LPSGELLERGCFGKKLNTGEEGEGEKKRERGTICAQEVTGEKRGEKKKKSQRQVLAADVSS